MRVFVTGASGWIGSAVIPELIAAGHDVIGLARSDASAAAVAATGAEALRGTLLNLDALRAAAAASDGVIHLAFQHDIAFSGRFQEAADTDRRAVDALAETLAGSGRPLVIASGTTGVALGRVATERDGHDLSASEHLAGGPRTRATTAERVLSLAARDVRSSVLRLPPTVHGDGDHGFMAALVAIARQRGVSGYIDDGSNRWAAVHRLDAAKLFRLALEKATAGSTLHAIADEGVPIRDVAEVIGRHRTCRRTPSLATPQASTSAGWRISLRWTPLRRARGRASCWSGSRPSQGSSKIWTRVTTSSTHPLEARAGLGGASLWLLSEWRHAD